MRKIDSTPEQWSAYLKKCRVRLKAWRAANRSAFNAARRAERAKDPEKKRKIEREYNARSRDLRAAAGRLRRTGMSSKLYEKLVQLQKDLCAVCRQPFALGRRCADHNHDTKEPRGLLCIHCNAVEGHAKKVGLAPGELGARLDAYLINPPAKKCYAS